MWCASPGKGHISPRARHVVVFTGHKGLVAPVRASRLTVIVSRTPEVTAWRRDLRAAQRTPISICSKRSLCCARLQRPECNCRWAIACSPRHWACGNRRRCVRLCCTHALGPRISRPPHCTVDFSPRAHHLVMSAWGKIQRAMPGQRDPLPKCVRAAHALHVREGRRACVSERARGGA